MEASEALGAAGEQTAAEGQAEAQQPEIPQVIADRFGELDRTFGERFDQLQEALGARQPEYGESEHGYGQEQEQEPLVFQGEDGRLYEAHPHQPGVDPQIAGALQQMAQQQQELAQRQEAFEQEQREKWQDDRAGQLEDQYEDFRDQKYAEGIVNELHELSAAKGIPQIASDPDFAELIHLARVGAQRAAGQETPAGASEQGVALETDGVSNAGGSDVDPGDRIVQAATGRNSFFNS